MIFSDLNFGGTFEFGDLAHYVRGEPSLYRLNRGQPTVSFTNNSASAFVEDTILLRPDVSLTAGLRDDVLSHVARAHNFAPQATTPTCGSVTTAAAWT